MVEPTKEELSAVLNEFLGTNIKFHKLSKDDLVELATVINNPKIICKEYVNDIRKKENPKEKVIEGIVDIARKWDGPIVRKLKQIATDPDKE